MSIDIKILIVEHDRVDLELLHHELKTGGINYISEVVQSEQDYVQALDKFTPDIILSDYSFPSFHGIIAFNIRKEKAPDTPFIFVSGTIGEEKSIELIKNGLTDYVLKEKLFTLSFKVKRALKEAEERKEKTRTEKELAHSERLLARAQQVAQLGSWDMNFSDNVLGLSNEACRIFGLPLTQNKLSFETWSALIHPGDLDYFLQTFKESKDSSKDTFYQHRIVLKNGSTRHIYSESKFEFDSNGKAIGLYGIMQDITEKIKAGEQLEFEKIDKEALINSTDDMMWSVSHDHKLIAGNNAFIKGIAAVSKMTLGAGDNLLARDILSPANLLFWKEAYNKTFSGESFKIEKYTTGANYWKESWADISFNPIYKDEVIIAIACYSRNITDRKIAEEKIKESEARLAEAQYVSKVGSWEANLSTMEVIWSEETRRIFGIQDADSTTSYQDYLQFVHPDDKEKVAKAFLGSVDKNAADAIEHRIITPNGITKIVEERWHMVSDNNDIPVRAIGTIQDITERRKAEQLINESEAKFRIFFENSMDGIILSINDGEIIAANPAACALFQMTAEEICNGGRFGIVDIVHPDANTPVKEPRLHGKARGEFILMRKDGTKFPGEISTVLFNGPKGQEITSIIIRDITDRKHAKEKFKITYDELQHAVNDLNKIMDSSLDVICAVSAEGYFMKVSAASEAVWGYKPEELVGKPLINFVYAEDQAKTLGVATNVMTGNNTTNFENRYVCKDGSLVTMEWSARWDANDQVRYGVARDVTRKKKLEKAFEIERRRLNDLFSQAPASMGILKGANHVFEIANPLYLKLIGKKDIIGKQVREVMPELARQGFMDLLDKVYKTGETFVANETLVRLDQNSNGRLVDKYLNFIYQAYRNPDGNIDGIIFFVVDVTEEVLSRKIIEASKNRFRAIIEKSTEMVTLSNVDGKIFYASPSVTKTFGYPNEDVSQAVSFSFVHPDDVKEFTENRNDLLHTEGKSYATQVRLRHKNGNWIWCEVVLTNMLHEPGVNAIVSNFRDITEKKTAEELQEFNANNLNALINNTNDLMWSVDRDFRLITSNQPFDQMGMANFGITATNGRSVLAAAYSPEILNHFKRLYERAFEGEAFTETGFFTTPADAWTEISYYPIHKGNEIIGTACHSRDITERKKAEESNRFKAALLNTIGQATISTDLKGTINFWNKAAEEIYGWTAGEAFGKNIVELTLAQQTKDQASEIMEKYSQGQSWSGEFQARRKNGESFSAFISNAPVFDEEYKLSGNIGVSADITDRKLSEILLKELNQDLLTEAKKLEISNTELEQFAYVASHDLQEPLRMITSFLTQLEKKYGNIIDEKGKKYIAFAVDGAKRMRQIILDLLEFSRVGRTEDNKEYVDLNEMVAEIQILFRKKIEEKHAIISVGELPVMYGHKVPLHQVFQNLISNALKYSRKNIHSLIRISAKELERHWQFTVADNGIGIGKEYFDKIFIIFQRLHNKDEYSGTGMGLAVTKKIIENLGGEIWLESAEGEGSTFYFTLLKEY